MEAEAEEEAVVEEEEAASEEGEEAEEEEAFHLLEWQTLEETEEECMTTGPHWWETWACW